MRRTERFFEKFPYVGDVFQACPICNREPCSCWDVRLQRLLDRILFWHRRPKIEDVNEEAKRVIDKICADADGYRGYRY